jgi:hypothetical protein
MASSVRWKVGQLEVEVSGDENFIEKHLEEFEARFLSKAAAGIPRPESPVDTPLLPGDIAPGEFYSMAGPDSGIETLLVLGRYLHTYRQQQSFTKADIRQLCGEIRIKDVHSQYYTTAFKRGLIRPAGEGMAVTLSGDKVVDGLIARAKRAEVSNE